MEKIVTKSPINSIIHNENELMFNINVFNNN